MSIHGTPILPEVPAPPREWGDGVEIIDWIRREPFPEFAGITQIKTIDETYAQAFNEYTPLDGPRWSGWVARYVGVIDKPGPVPGESPSRWFVTSLWLREADVALMSFAALRDNVQAQYEDAVIATNEKLSEIGARWCSKSEFDEFMQQEIAKRRARA
jgi:hypothetical protein